MICFVCNQQLSLRLVFTIRLSYLAQILPFKFIASVTCVLNSSWWKNILFSSQSIQMSWMCIHRSIGLSDYFRWVTSSEIRTMQGHLGWGLNWCYLGRIYWEHSDHARLGFT